MAILTRKIKLSGFSRLPKVERDKQVSEFFQAAFNPTQSELEQQQQELNTRIQYFEDLHQMSSEEMKRKLAAGEIRETADICSWLMFLNIRSRFESAPKPSRT